MQGGVEPKEELSQLYKINRGQSRAAIHLAQLLLWFNSPLRALYYELCRDQKHFVLRMFFSSGICVVSLSCQRKAGNVCLTTSSVHIMPHEFKLRPEDRTRAARKANIKGGCVVKLIGSKDSRSNQPPRLHRCNMRAEHAQSSCMTPTEFFGLPPIVHGMLISDK